MSPGSESLSREDQTRLDELFGALVQAITDGQEVDLKELLSDRPDLVEHATEYLVLAKRVAVRTPSERPSFPGYEIIREIGRGGMGRVYLARHQELAREVALKTLPAQWLTTPRSKARFEREARAIARLAHPSIIPIFAVGESGEVPFFTMEYVKGRPLSAVLNQLRSMGKRSEDLLSSHVSMDPSRTRDDSYVRFAAELIRDVARALAHAHGEGVIHRDVKPSNIMIRPNGTPLLFDFGLASVDEEEGLTLTGDFVGTPHYVSPEQARGDRIHASTDVFSLGATLYEFMTLERPFSGVTTREILRSIQEREPRRPCKLNPGVSRDLETICLTALAKEPKRRYASAAALADDLDRTLNGLPPLARAVGPLGRGLRLMRRHPAASSAILLGFLLVIGTPTALLFQARTANARIQTALDTAKESEHQAQISAEISRKERDRADEKAAIASEVSQVLTGMFDSLNPANDGRDVRVADVLDNLTNGLTSLRPAVRAPLERIVGLSYGSLTMLPEAFEHQTIAADLFGAIPNATASERLGTRAELISTLALLGRFDEVLDRSRVLFADYKEAGLRDEGLVLLYSARGTALQYLDRAEEALQDFRAAVDLSAEFDVNHQSASSPLSGLANALAEAGRMAESLEIKETIVQQTTSEMGPLSPASINALGELAWAIHQDGNSEDALTMMLDAAGKSVEVFGKEHRDTAIVLHQLAGIQFSLGTLQEAEKSERDAIASASACLPENDPLIASAHEILSEILAAQGRLEEAIAAQQQAVSGREALLGKASINTIESRFLLARYRFARGDLEGAARDYETAAAGAREATNPPPILLPIILSNLVDIYTDLGATAKLKAAREEFERTRGPLDRALQEAEESSD